MRPYGSGGKNWNVGLSDPGRLAATQAQHWRLQKLTGMNHRGRGLTRDQASELIEEAAREKAARKEGITGPAYSMFNAMYAKAVEQANRAGDLWMQEHPEPIFSIADPESGSMIGVHGTIGRAWITWPKVGSDFHKWLMEEVYDGKKKEISIPHKYAERLEGSLQLACERAAFEVLKMSAAPMGGIRLMYRTADPVEQALHAA